MMEQVNVTSPSGIQAGCPAKRKRLKGCWEEAEIQESIQRIRNEISGDAASETSASGNTVPISSSRRSRLKRRLCVLLRALNGGGSVGGQLIRKAKSQRRDMNEDKSDETKEGGILADSCPNTSIGDRCDEREVVVKPYDTKKIKHSHQEYKKLKGDSMKHESKAATKKMSISDYQKRGHISAARTMSKKTCLRCRGRGHLLVDCPLNAGREQSQSNSSEQQGEFFGICFACGSSKHGLSSCPKRRKLGDSGLPFALCFICGLKGHISASCPQNSKGIYPLGGGCRICGSSHHLAVSCPSKKKTVHVKESKSGSSSTRVRVLPLSKLKNAQNLREVDPDEFWSQKN